MLGRVKCAVNAFIEQFMKSSMAYRDPNPRSYRFDEIKNWGMVCKSA